MARLNTIGFEEQTLDAGIEVDSYFVSNGTILLDPNIAHSGISSLKTSSTGVAGNAYAKSRFTDVDADGPYYFRFYLYIQNMADVASGIFTVENAASSRRLTIYLNTDSTLLLYDKTTQIGAASPALSMNTWYMVECSYFNNIISGKAELSARLDGTEFAATTVSTNTGGVNFIGIGPHNGTNWIYNFDDIAINNTTGDYQNTFAGQGRVVNIHPDATGNASQFYDQFGGTPGTVNNYTRIKENPPDDNTSYVGALVANITDLYHINLTDLSFSDMINVVSQVYRGFGNQPNTSKFKLQVFTQSATAESAEIQHTSTGWMNGPAFPHIPLLNLYLAPTGYSWIYSNLLVTQIGYTISTAGSSHTFFTNTWLVVDYFFGSVTLHDLFGVSNIKADTDRTIFGKSSLLAVTDKTITGVSTITNTHTATISGKGDIFGTTPKTITGKAQIISTQQNYWTPVTPPSTNWTPQGTGSSPWGFP